MTDAKRRSREDRGGQENRRYRLERFNMATELADEFYATKPNARPALLLSVIRRAKSGNAPMLRDILTARYWLYPDYSKRNLFPRGRPEAYKTIGQLTNILCLRSPWRQPVDVVVKGGIELDLDWVTNIEGDGLPSESEREIETGEYSPDRIHPFYTCKAYPFPFRRKLLYPIQHDELVRRTPDDYWATVETVSTSKHALAVSKVKVMRDGKLVDFWSSDQEHQPPRYKPLTPTKYVEPDRTA
jgi:hypothetical protein